jgi:hypothetical protein
MICIAARACSTGATAHFHQKYADVSKTPEVDFL